MAVNISTIADQIKALGESMLTQTDAEQAKTLYSQQMAQIIAQAILSAEVNPGITVQVAVPAGAGATTGTGTLQ